MPASWRRPARWPLAGGRGARSCGVSPRTDASCARPIDASSRRVRAPRARAGARRRVALRQLPHHRGGPSRGPPGPAPRLRRGAAEALGTAPRTATRASTPWPWPWSPTPTASWTRPASSGSSGRSRKSRPLTIGELWAVPTMLRLVLLENLRRLAEQMLWRWDERRRADRWAADALDGGRARRGGARGRSRGRRARSPGEATDPFVVRLLQLFRDHDPRSAAALGLLEAELDLRGIDAERGPPPRAPAPGGQPGLRRQLRHQPPPPVGAGLERLLRAVQRRRGGPPRRPGGGLPAPGLRRRGTATARPSRRSPGARTPTSWPSRAMRWSWPAPPASEARHAAHVGFYLVDRGQAALKAKFGYRAPWREWLVGWALRHPRATYFGAIAALLGALMALVAGAGLGARVASWWLPATLLVLLLPTSELAVGLVNHLLTLLLPPRVLPKLDFKDGIPADCATFVVMPAMLLPAAERGGAAGAAGDPLPGQPRPAAPLRPADRLRRRPAGDDARGRRLPPATPSSGVAGPQRALRRRRAGPVLPLPPPPAVEPGRRAAGWAGSGSAASSRSSTACSAGDRDTSYAVVERRPGGPAARSASSSRSTPTPSCRARRPAGWSGRWPTRSTGRGSTRSGGRVVEGYGVLQPRVSFHLTAATRSRFAALLAGSAGHRPVLDGRLRRLQGPVRERQLHRQGHLRRRRLRGGRRARPSPRTTSSATT